MPVVQERSSKTEGPKKIGRSFRKKMAAVTGLHHVLDRVSFSRRRSSMTDAGEPAPVGSQPKPMRKKSEKEEMAALMRAARPPPPTTTPSGVVRAEPTQPQPTQPPPAPPASQATIAQEGPVVRAELVTASPTIEPVVAEPVIPEEKKRKAEEIVVEEPKKKKKEAMALVLDAGSHQTRAGVAGAEEPTVEVASVVGRRRLSVGGDLAPEAFGTVAESAAAAYNLVRPVEHQTVVDWDGAERLWRHALYACDEYSTKILLTTGPLCPKATKERLVKFCLEDLGFEYAHVGVAAVLALFGAGYTTGCVVDCGLNSARCVPVYEGYALPHACLVDKALGGLAVDAHASRILEGKGLAFRNPQAALQAGEHIKLQAAVVDFGFDETVDTISVRIPARMLSTSSRDRDTVDLTSDDRQAMGETTFKPQVFNKSTESPGLAGFVQKAITACALDLRRELYEGVMLVGGASLIPGLPERLDHDLKHLAPDGVDVAVTAYENRHHAAFVGAAVVAALPDFQDNWVSADVAQDPKALDSRLAYGC